MKMTKTETWFKLTKSELQHLRTLIEFNEREGCYYGKQSQYWNRSERLKAKIENLLKL